MEAERVKNVRQTEPQEMRKPGSVSVPITWLDAEEMPIQFANQFMIQSSDDEVVLAIGQLCAPILSGSEEEQAEQLRKRGSVNIRAVAKIGMSKARLREFVALLNTVLKAGEGG